MIAHVRVVGRGVFEYYPVRFNLTSQWDGTTGASSVAGESPSTDGG
ncbi:hypothetical protein AB0C02_26345 [Micromonospora sp. NPDC048999]